MAPVIKKKISKAELKRLHVLHAYEEAARLQGYSLIAGVDEAGRGPLAGPVVAAACIIPQGIFLAGIDDSKKLSPVQRCEFYEQIMSDSRIHVGVGIVSHQEIDQINILQATIKAMLQAIQALVMSPDCLLVDGLKLEHPTIPSQKIIKGDSLSHSIAAASVIAKETRDRLMVEEDKKWPQYGFKQHKGYGTPAHVEALKRLGPSPIHRLSFKLKENLGN
ncbi:MAG: ribonuclease HII [Parachlamydiaceae bacterium]|nr:ribonuclease HII [Parachlamydiaceae bacterium]